MTVLIHVLGSDILTITTPCCGFFNDTLAATSEHAREFMVAGEDNGFTESCPALSLRFYGSKKALAQAVIAKAKANRRQRFFFHGQFNTSLWLALLSGGIKPAQFLLAYLGRGSLRSVPRAEIPPFLPASSYRAGASRGAYSRRAAISAILRVSIRTYAASCSISRRAWTLP
ncbi:4-alpha-L-fucosyl transferase [Salmonella enterica subsp. enterica serovar Typhimurium]|nr:4-alpha-L-fucosyl transferase [Salmonella enterica subsp. enterica serovar Typhimurium]